MPALSDIKIDLVEANNGIELAATGIDINVDSDFDFKYLFISASGTANIKIKNAGVDVEADMSTQPGNNTSELAPSLKISKINININPDDIDIQLHGGLVTKIASVLIPLLKSTVIPDVIKQVESQVPQLVDTTVDQDLAEYGIQQEIPYLAGVTFDYAQMAAGPKVSAGVFEMGVNGTFFDA